jgi:hypothetical protein
MVHSGPGRASLAETDDVLTEASALTAAGRARLGYLLSGVRPDVAGRITSAGTSTTYLGPRGRGLAKRHDSRWQVVSQAGIASPATMNITPAWVARHTPNGAGSMEREAALIDIAQDLILRDLHTIGLLDELVYPVGDRFNRRAARG